MDRVEIVDGPLKGLKGDAVFFPNARQYSVSFPDYQNPQYKEIFPPESLKVLENEKPSILEKKEFRTLHFKKEHVQIIGCKVSCSSVWCPECFKRKGASRRIADRLAKLKWQATRQVVLTVDLKKFSNSGQIAFETLKEAEALNQFIHNLKRTAGINIKDWVWILEWHTDGAPHWHLFIETETGKKGQIGNANLLKYWKHGLVFESFIKSEKHWRRFTSYFGSNGYFDPKSKSETKNKQHQIELPAWAKQVSYKIRKTGSMIHKKDSSREEDLEKEYHEEDTANDKIKKTPKTYEQILSSCGQATLCQIRRGEGNLIWKKIPIPYSELKQFPGEYIDHTGYFMQMTLEEFNLFIALFDSDVDQIKAFN